MRLVVVESPYAGQIIENLHYARACVKDCIQRGESPIASHLLLTQSGILDDSIPGERKLGLTAGTAWYRVADAVVFYTDRGFSPGMQAALELARQTGISVEHRSLSANQSA